MRFFLYKYFNVICVYFVFSYFIQTRTLVRIGLNVSCKFFAHKAVDLERERICTHAPVNPEIGRKKKTKEKW